jgi:hypothetical protein
MEVVLQRTQTRREDEDDKTEESPKILSLRKKYQPIPWDNLRRALGTNRKKSEAMENFS